MTNSAQPTTTNRQVAADGLLWTAPGRPAGSIEVPAAALLLQGGAALAVQDLIARRGAWLAGLAAGRTPDGAGNALVWAAGRRE